MNSTKKIMKIIEDQRALKRMSMEELAKLTGTSRSSISRYKNGEREFPVNKAHQFAQALGLTTSQILGMNEVEDESLAGMINSLDEDNRKAVYEYVRFLKNNDDEDHK